MSRSMDRGAKKQKGDIPNEIARLAETLASEDITERRKARQELATIGQPAVAALVDALTDPRIQVRWEAAKALVEIADPAAAPALIRSLEDENSDIRWLAAEALIASGKAGLVPLLRALEERADSLWLREGAHHVLVESEKTDLGPIVTPVLVALRDIAPAEEVPLAAKAALEAMEGTG
jgi:HEAT repeat protein